MSIKRKMLDKWAAKLDERRAIMEFWDWFLDDQSGNLEDIGFRDIEKTLDKYHGIDQRQLEKERRDLLELAQERQG